MKKILFSLIFLTMGFFISVSVFAEESGQEYGQSEIPIEIQTQMAAQDEALEIYSKIMKIFEDEGYLLYEYPAFYGGAYIDDNNILVLQIKNVENLLKDKQYSFLFDNTKVRIDEVDYSYNELEGYQTISNILLRQFPDSVVCDYVDVMNNVFAIGISKDFIENALFIHETEILTKDRPIHIFESEKCEATANIWGGSTAYNSSGAQCTIGICGTYNGGNAFVTCGHAMEQTGYNQYPSIIYNGTTIGQILYQQANMDPYNYAQNAWGDFSISSLAAGNNTTNYVYPGYQITGTYSSVPIGTMMYKYGSSTQYSWGSVTAENVRVQYSRIVDGLITVNYYVSGLYQMTMTNSAGTAVIGAGDSGGPVWRTSGSSKLLQGIVTAGISNLNIVYSTPIYYPILQGFTVKTN